MKEIPFSAALRAEIDAVVARYEALVSAQQEMLSALHARDAEARRGELFELRAERDRLVAGEAAQRSEVALLRARVEELDRALGEAKRRLRDLEAEARSATEAAKELGEQFAVEQRFVVACQGLEGCLLAEALKSAAGRDLDTSPSTYAALKSRGLEVILIQAFRERGRSVVQAPLLERESRALPAITAAAGCELISPEAGQRFAAASMEKVSTLPEPAEEGNVLSCSMPGARRSGTDGALVLPKVVVASG